MPGSTRFGALAGFCLALSQVAAAQNAAGPSVTGADTAARGPSLARIAVGALIGGALGAGVGTLVALPFARAAEPGIGAGIAQVAIGIGIGVPVGTLLGTRYAATFPGRRPPSSSKIVLASLLGLAAGGLVMGTIGNSFDSPDSYNAWHIGAGAGLVTHLSITSLMARRAGRDAPLRK